MTSLPPLPIAVSEKVQKRIDALTREKYEARREAEQAKQEAEMLREMRSNGDPVNLQDIEQVQALVKQEAVRLRQEETFNQACNKVYESGLSEFKDFDKSLSSLQLVGVSRDFLEIVADSGVGAKLIHHLGSNLDEAARITALPPAKMAREITLLETKLASQKKQISNAPEPIKPISAIGNNPKSYDQMTDREFAEFRRKEKGSRR